MDVRTNGDRRDRRAGRCRQEHGRPRARGSGSASATSTPGAMYRSLTWLALQRGLPLGDGERARRARARAPGRASTRPGRVFIGGHRRHRLDPAGAGRPHGAGRRPPPEVREVMRERQRELAVDGDVVIEGRDIGTVVAPGRGGEGLPRRRSRGSRRAAGRPSGPRSAPTRSRPTSSCATSPTRRGCSPPPMPRRSTRPSLAIDEVIDADRGPRPSRAPRA